MMGRTTKTDRAQKVIGVLDIGTSKIAAAVVVATGGAQSQSGFRIAGLGLQKSKGVKAGVLVDLDEAETAVRAAIGQAERAAGVTVEGVTVSVACGRLKSLHFSATADIEYGVVTDGDLQQTISGGRAYAERDGRMLIHMNRVGFRLDGFAGVADPRGLSGRKLSAQLHAVTADEAPVRNLLMLIERCYLECHGLVAAPYASALAVTTAEEREVGVTCVDMGAGTTSISQFGEGRFLYADVVPVGSQHVTFDIAKALQTSLGEAERIKSLYGTLASALSDEHDTFHYELAADDAEERLHCSKAQLSGIIRPRVAQILDLVRERMAASPATAVAGNKIVLTGGAIQLIGISDFVSSLLGRPVRAASPIHVAGLGQSVSGPQFSTLVGLATASVASEEEIIFEQSSVGKDRGYLGRVGNWLKAGF